MRYVKHHGWDWLFKPIIEIVHLVTHPSALGCRPRQTFSISWLILVLASLSDWLTKWNILKSSPNKLNAVIELAVERSSQCGFACFAAFVLVDIRGRNVIFCINTNCNQWQMSHRLCSFQTMAFTPKLITRVQKATFCLDANCDQWLMSHRLRSFQTVAYK